jgi:putative PIG3 family NAD(P)H quinone oxidoreductase
MTAMFAVTLPSYGGPDVLTWAEVPDAVAAPGEVLIDVVAAGVNRADLLQRAGFYNPPPGTSPYPGMEVSGRIAAVGPGVTEWRVGNEVCALLAGGGYAERVAVPATQVLPIPYGVDVIEAAGLPEVACTVWSNLTRVAHMSHWQTLLVHGGGSGIGTFAIQYASSLGVRVFTTARGPKHEVLKALGADLTIDYTTQDFVAEANAATNGRGVELILDIQGAPYLNRNIDALADGGHLVIIGLQGGRTGEIDLGAMLAKRVTVTATTLRSRPAADKASIVEGVLADVWPLIESRRIMPVTDRTVPMSQAAAAHEILASSEHIGKVLLVAPGYDQPAIGHAAVVMTDAARDRVADDAEAEDPQAQETAAPPAAPAAATTPTPPAAPATTPTPPAAPATTPTPPAAPATTPTPPAAPAPTAAAPVPPTAAAPMPAAAPEPQDPPGPATATPADPTSDVDTPTSASAAPDAVPEDAAEDEARLSGESDV